MKSVAEVAVVAVVADAVVLVVDSKGSIRGGVATQGQDLHGRFVSKGGCGLREIGEWERRRRAGQEEE